MYVRTDDLTHPKPLPLSQLRALYLAEFTTSAARQIPLSAIAVSRALSSSFVLLEQSTRVTCPSVQRTRTLTLILKKKKNYP